MKYKIRYWNDSKRVLQTLYYPYLETTLLMAYQLAKYSNKPIAIIEKDKVRAYIVGV